MTKLHTCTFAVECKCCWLWELRKKHKVQARIISLGHVNDNGRMEQLVELSACYSERKKFRASLRTIGAIRNLNIMTGSEGTALVSAEVPEEAPCALVQRFNCFLLHGAWKDTTDCTLTVGGTSSSLNRFFNHLKDRWHLALTSQSQFDRGAPTYRQLAALALALEMGYFDVPKRVKLSELAESLSVSAPADSEMVRRGLRVLLKREIPDAYEIGEKTGPRRLFGD
jgi:predicted DNA binding protein